MSVFTPDAIYQIVKLSEELGDVRLAYGRLKADFNRVISINDRLIEDDERMKEKLKEVLAERNQLVEELADERHRHDKLQDFEVAEAEDLRESKLYLRILLEYLQETGQDVEKLEKIVALKRCIMKLEENNE